MSHPDVEAITERIALPAVVEPDVDPTLTGEIRRVATWWSGLAGDQPIVVREIVATSATSALEALVTGAHAADAAVDAGATLLVPRVEDRDPRAARIVIAVLARAESPTVVPQPEGMPDREWMAAVADVRDNSARLASLRGDCIALLEDLQAASIAFCSGALLAGAARRTPCIIDGTDEHAAAMVADRLSARAKAWWIAGSQSSESTRRAAVDRIGLQDGLPLALSDESGWGARSTIALLRLMFEAQ